MNKKHIGDNLDLMKRAVLSACAQAFDNLRVEPLVTGDDVKGHDWAETDYQNYAAVLGIELAQVQRDKRPPWAALKNRTARLEWLRSLNEHKGDWFFDPDTGLEPSSGGKRCHLPNATVGELTGRGQKRRMVVVYQHVPRGTEAEVSAIRSEMRNKVASVIKLTPGGHCLTTIGQEACLLCFCRDRLRLEKVKESLAWLEGSGRLDLI